VGGLQDLGSALVDPPLLAHMAIKSFVWGVYPPRPLSPDNSWIEVSQRGSGTATAIKSQDESIFFAAKLKEGCGLRPERHPCRSRPGNTQLIGEYAPRRRDDAAAVMCPRLAQRKRRKSLIFSVPEVTV